MIRYAILPLFWVILSAMLMIGGCATVPETTTAARGALPIRAFVLAGDESVLEKAPLNGSSDEVYVTFYPTSKPTRDEQTKHVACEVYTFGSGVDYDKQTPIATGVVELGEPRTRRIHPKKRGRVEVPLTPYPKAAFEKNTTTLLRGFLSVSLSGRYAFHPGADESALNVTTVEGTEVYRRDNGEAEAIITPIQLEPGKRYAFRTLFFKQPGHDFRVPLLNKPGTLSTVVDENKHFAFLKHEDGTWATRDDVVLHDAHPIHNNTRAMGHFLVPGDISYGGEIKINAMGPELMLGHVLGDHLEEPVLILRFGVRHRTWFHRGSRSLGHDFRPPSSGGGSDLDGGWDVIHFNFGVWDATYRDKTSKYFSGHNTTSAEDFEKNLRTLVGKMKQTGATLIWGTVTPVWKGDNPDTPNADVTQFNAVAAKVMKENGVIINDLYSEVHRLGFPKSNNVHSVGNLAPKVTAVIKEAIASRKQNTQPLPRVLLIGDSITGSYQKTVMSNLDGEAFVCKNPGNAEDTWNGLERMDEWLDLQRYLLNGQEYMEFVDGIRYAFDNMDRVYPEYDGRAVELSGLIWFQGIADSGSDSMADEYATHLPNLIRDLRKEFKSPNLPVVVTALGYEGEAMRPNMQKVVDAQMAVGDAERFPEFSGNVASVDTRPFLRPKADGPGGRPQDYYSHAATFLEIGEAMGNAMIGILPGE